MIGKCFKVSFFGESHGRCVGVLIDGCPPGIQFSENELKLELSRRMPGASMYVSRRVEREEFEVLSGIFKEKTTGAPIVIIVRNVDVDSREYEKLRFLPRPSHADYPAWIKYFGHHDYRGGGIFSGRLTIGHIIAGYFAKKILRRYGVKVLAHLIQIGGVRVEGEIRCEEIEERVWRSPVRCVDSEKERDMIKLLREVMRKGDSVGGVVEAIAINVPAGLGEPPIDTLEGEISKMIFTIPGVKGIEFGSGFKLACMKGSEANDQYRLVNGRIVTSTNHSGGIIGGISSGMPIRVRVAFKPTPSISKPQRTVDLTELKEKTIVIKGRHDPCIAIRAVPVVEAALSIVLADHLLRRLSWTGLKNSG